MDISIIIPTLNEAACIEQTISLIRQNLSSKCQVEIILIDAGSQDQTVNLIRNQVDLCQTNEAFKYAKYKSLNHGADLASGDVLLFLDADCEVPRNFDEHILDTLKDEKVAGGAFEFQMKGRGFSFRIIEFINRMRYRITKNYFGDQGLFCRRSIFEAVAGFPDEPIMEAAFLCRKLRKKGKLRLVKSKLVSSIRRFEQGGPVTVLAKDTVIWIQFLLYLDIKRYAAAYWAENEKGE